MYDRDDVELALAALEEGWTLKEAAELVGAARSTVRARATGVSEPTVRKYLRAESLAELPPDPGRRRSSRCSSRTRTRLTAGSRTTGGSGASSATRPGGSTSACATSWATRGRTRPCSAT